MAESRTQVDETLADRESLLDTDDHDSGGLSWPPDRPPTRLGRFQIVRVLGEGAMGVVYEALDPRSQRPIAIKSITRLSPRGLYRFKQEFRSLVRFQHPNVVTLHELVFADNRLFFSMELVEGTDFISHLCGSQRTPDGVPAPCRDHARLRDAIRQLVTGVHAIHAAGLLHRDIKPSNVRVTPEGRVVLLDFGLVQQYDSEADLGMTDDGMVLGTPLYMAPEQVVKARVGPPADWYGVGGLLYEALTGRPPFAAQGVIALLAAKQYERPPAPSSHTEDIPPDLEQLCMQLLDPNPDERPTGDALFEQVAGWITEVSASSSAMMARREPVPATPPFLGREPQFESLREAASVAARERRAVVALVDGVSGMGKSALVRRFLDDLATQPEVLVLEAKCSERESIPYKALDSVMDALCSYLRRSDTASIEALLPRDPQAVARLFPVLMSVPAVAAAPSYGGLGNDPHARRRAFAALRELLGRLGARRRLVVHIDDLHWTDLDSAVLLDAIIRDPDAPSMLLIGVFRTGAERGDGPLPRLVSELGHDPRVDLRRIHVGPMTHDEASRLALSMLGEQTRQHRALADEVARESEGSPFFVGELVRYAFRTAEEAALPVSDSDSSVSLDSVIRHRIALLPESIRSVLEVVAVAGGSIDRDIVLAVAMGAAADTGAIARLRDESLLRVVGSQEHEQIDTYHDRIRETTLRAIDPERRADLHLALARAFEAKGGADAVALSHHFRQAGEDQRATRHTLDAAAQAEEAMAYDRAAQLYRAALELQAIPAAELPALEARLAAALANAGRLYESAKAYLRAAAASDEPRERFEWNRLAADQLLTSGHGDEGRDALRTVLGSVGLSLPKTKARAIASLLRHRAALALGGLTVRLREPDQIAPAELERLDATWTASRGLVYLDGIVGADFHARHLRLALRCGEPLRISRALAVEAHILAILQPHKRVPRALELLEEAGRLAEQSGNPAAIGFQRECHGHVWLSVGRWQEAHQVLSEAMAMFRECTGVAQELSYCAAHGALCLFFMGRFRELAEQVEGLVHESTDRANPYVEGYARGLSSSVRLGADQVAEAQRELEIYEREAPRHFEAHRLNFVAQVGQLRRYVGDAEGAWSTCEAEFGAVSRLTVMSARMAKAEALLWRGASALAGATRGSSPEPLLQEAERRAGQLLRFSMPHVRAYGHLTRAGARALRGDQAGAAEDLRHVIELASERNMAAHVATAQRRLAAIVGGSEGQRLQADSDAYMQAEGIVRPDRLTDMIAPGFVRA